MSQPIARGRPKAPARLVPLNIYVQPELAAWLDAQALQHSRTRSNMAATLLEAARQRGDTRKGRTHA